jgi:AbrB family looped-hinge helix DNA binding protein
VLTAKVTTRNQITLPSEARRKLGIQPGDRLTVEVRGDELVLRRRPARASDRLMGIAKGAYGPDPDRYLRELRKEAEAGIRERREMVDRQSGQPRPPDRWQAMEREPDADVSAGRFTVVEGIEDLISHLDE